MLRVGAIPMPVPALPELLALTATTGGDGPGTLTTGDTLRTEQAIGRTPAVSITFAPAPSRPDADVTLTMTAGELAAYRRLAPEQQRRFVTLHRVMMGHGDQATLRGLLAGGKLGARAADGRTTLEHLDLARTVPMPLPQGENRDTYRREQLGVLVRHLADPTTIFQGNRNTCGPTTAQIVFATQQPADYVRFAVGLMSREGKGHLPSGAVVSRPADALHGTNDRRPALSRMFQAALMHWASPVSYTDRSDSHGIELPLIGRVNLASGASGQMMSQWLRAIREDRTESLATTDITEIFDGGGPIGGVGDEDVVTAISQELARQRRRGETVPLVPIELEWGRKSMHYVAVSRITADRVFFLNPHGNLFQSYRHDAQGRPRTLYRDPANGLTFVEARYSDGGPLVRFYSDGSQSMSRRELQERILGASVDTQIARHHHNAPGNRFDPPF